MTLDEAIKHAEEVAERKEDEGKLICQSEAASMGCLTCAKEHRQLAEWLKDYKRLLEQEPIEDMPCVSREEMQKCKEIVKKYTPKQELPDTVSRGVFEQFMWERDIAIEQLHELGYELGQKIEPCDAVVNREAVIKAVDAHTNEDGTLDDDISIILEDLPSVTQKSGKMLICPSCNLDVHSDFSRCPRCGARMVEPQESEDKE